MQKGALVTHSTTDTLKKSRLRERTDRAWFSRLVRHPTRKRRGSILTTLDPATTTTFNFCLNGLFLPAITPG